MPIEPGLEGGRGGERTFQAERTLEAERGKLGIGQR